MHADSTHTTHLVDVSYSRNNQQLYLRVQTADLLGFIINGLCVGLWLLMLEVPTWNLKLKSCEKRAMCSVVVGFTSCLRDSQTSECIQFGCYVESADCSGAPKSVGKCCVCQVGRLPCTRTDEHKQARRGHDCQSCSANLSRTIHSRLMMMFAHVTQCASMMGSCGLCVTGGRTLGRRPSLIAYVKELACHCLWLKKVCNSDLPFPQHRPPPGHCNALKRAFFSSVIIIICQFRVSRSRVY